ncbi:hypothetical protein HID58_074719 [Brassica napus]|uniref:Uncharacterized protein n=1 Tax=Brassica napus TaxID=3708 RepID=A0ABQ7YHU2_BRANA|nr:hypothetical protein HID58_074719 [Brassica napus]
MGNNLEISVAAVYDEYHREKTWKRCTFSYFVPAVDISSISETQASHPLFADSASQSASPRYSLTDSPKARLNSNSGKTFSSYFSFGVRQYGNENEEEESESCPPKHGNGKNKAATMISSGQDKDSELHVSAKVEGDYDEGSYIGDLFEFLHACLPNIVRALYVETWYIIVRFCVEVQTFLVLVYWFVCFPL